MKKVKFYNENHFWKVRIEDDRFMICTWRKFYTICDKQEQIRGKDNYIDAYYDYINCDETDLREALYRLHMTEGMFIKDCTDLPNDIKQRIIEIDTVFDNVSENDVFLPNLEISTRNRVHLIITEVKE